MTQRYFDDILTRIQTGRWNFIYFVGVGILAFMIPSLVLAGSFLTPSVDHLCNIPPVEANETKVELNQCSYAIIMEGDFNKTDVKEMEECSDWEYDHDVFASSITEEFDLVCDNDYLRPTYQTMYMIGMFIGAPVNGFFADRFGRKTILGIGSIFYVASVLISSFVTNFSVLLGLRFISGLSHPSTLQTGYILCVLS